MTDGAHLGIGAGRALDTILGGKPSPKPDEGMTSEEMRANLEAAHDASSYEGSANVAAKRILAFLDAHPEFDRVPSEGQYDWTDREKYEGFHIVYPGMSELMSLAGVTFDDLGLSGFQYGWAVNAAKYARNAPPSPNPALLEIRA